MAPHSVEQLFNGQNHPMQLNSAKPMGQSGCGCKLAQPGQLTTRDELLGYHNNNNHWRGLCNSTFVS